MKQNSKFRTLLVLVLTLTMVFSIPAKSAWADNLPLTGLTINDFKIFDKNQGDIEIDYSYAMEQDPDAFTHAICEGQTNGLNKLKVDLTYDSATPFKEGDKLTIPAQMGSGYPSSPLPLSDGSGNVIGTWHFTGGSFVIDFSGDYIANNTVTQLNAVMETQYFLTSLGNQPKTFNKGERVVKEGRIGNKPFTLAYEKYYVVAEQIDSSDKSVGKHATSVTDSRVLWYYSINNDYKYKVVDGGNKYFSTPYMYNNDGAYKPDSFTGIYIEDTIYDALEVSVSNGHMGVSGITDDGKIISGIQGIGLNFNNLLTKVEQGTRTRAEVKAALQDGQYCLYQNADGTTTVMIKYWDMNNSNGFTYNDVPQIAAAGGVGNFLKARLPDIYGGVSDATIEKINNMYDGKAVQNISLVIKALYTPVVVPAVKENTAQITTDQLGTVDRKAIARQTPPAGFSDAPGDPLAIKLIKTDKDTSSGLSEGFKFALETSTDGGATWNEVTLTDGMVEKGTLNADNTITPLSSGVLQVKQLTGGNNYRFVEKAHPDEYQDVAIDDANPNDADHTTSANSKVLNVTTQGNGHVLVMYNEKKPAANYTEEFYKEDPNGTLEYNGKKYSIVTVDTKVKKGPIGDNVTPEDKDYPGFNKGDVTYKDSANPESTNALPIAADGSLVIRHFFEAKQPTDPVKEVLDINGQDINGKLLSPGEEIQFAITYTNSTGLEKQITITDQLSEFVDFVSADNGGTENNGTVTWTKSVADGEVFKVIVKATVKADVDGDVITNKANINDGTTDFETNETSNPTKGVPTVPTKEVFVGDDTTNVDGQEVKIGDELTYVVTYTNTTGEDKEITITDAISEFVDFVSADNGGTENAGTITWTKNVAEGQIFKVTYKVKVKDEVASEVITNKANVNDGTTDYETNETSNPVQPTYNATQTFVSGTPGKALPEAVLDLLPQPQVNLLDGSTVEPTQPVSTEVLVEGGKWVFKGYDADSKTLDGSDVNFEGTWEFEEAEVAKYKATHTFVSGSPGKNLPQAVLDILPEPKYNLEDGSTVEPTQPVSTEVLVEGGKWTFEGYDKQNATIDGSDVNFKGTWSFKEEEVAKYKATTTFVSGTPGKNLPQAVLDLLPEIKTGLLEGSEVSSTEPSVKEVKVEGGKWIFKSYNTDSHTIDGSDFNFEGTWEFVADGPDLPKTGTSTGMTSLYAMLFILSGIALAVFSRKRKLQ